MKKIGFILGALLMAVTLANAQDVDSTASPLTLGGYVKFMNTNLIESLKGNWLSENMFHNRLNFQWSPSSHFSAGLGLRNRLIYGDFVKQIPGYTAMAESDPGYMDMSKNISSGSSYFLNITADRLWLDYHQQGLDLRVGRQRINWGQTFVWNANDVFNSYSFFDFDYEERPGSDAVRLSLYPSSFSTVDMAAKLENDSTVTVGFLYKFNHWGYDIQLLGGELKGSDLFAGAGWSGSLGGAGFDGEVTYIRPIANFNGAKGHLLASVGGSYTFGNSLSLQGEVFYNGFASDSSNVDFFSYYYRPLDIKNLSFSKYSAFAQVSYPVTPLLSVSLAAMAYSQPNAYYFGPSATYSLSDNLEVDLSSQVFRLSSSGSYQNIGLVFFRLRQSF